MKRTLIAIVGALLALSLPAGPPPGLVSSAGETHPFLEFVNGLLSPVLAAQTGRGRPPTVAPPEESPRALDGLRYPAHYIVVEASGDEPIRVVHYQRVMLSGQPESLSDTELATRATSLRGRQTHTASVRLLDRSGRVAHQALATIPRWQRTETVRPESDPAARATGSRMEGHFKPLITATFVVRVPVLEGASRLEIRRDVGRDGSRVAAVEAPATELDLDALASEFGSSVAALQAAPSALVETIRNNGPSANRLDILYVGEGYPSGDLSWFRSDTSAFAAGFVSGSPMFEYAQHFNLWRLHVPSAERGADRPSCPGDDAEAAGQDTNTFVNTAFDATYCSGERHVAPVDGRRGQGASGSRGVSRLGRDYRRGAESDSRRVGRFAPRHVAQPRLRHRRGHHRRDAARVRPTRSPISPTSTPDTRRTTRARTSMRTSATNAGRTSPTRRVPRTSSGDAGSCPERRSRPLVHLQARATPACGKGRGT